MIAITLMMACAASTATAAGFLLSAKGRFSVSFTRGFEYDPEGYCYKPSRPFGDPSELALTLYRESAESYLDCLKKNANSDMQYAQAQIQTGYDKAVEEFLDEVRRGS